MMNERIEELAEESYNEFYNIHIDLKMFAELIVRECAQLVEDNMDPQNAWITPSYVKQHFGVE